MVEKKKAKVIVKRDAKGRIAKGGSKGASNKTNKNGTAGAPSKLDKKEIREKFLAAAAFAMNTTACCAYAGITRQTYYSYIEKHPNFLDEVEANNQIPYQKAVQTVVKAASKDPKIAMQYLERTKKDEFSVRQEITGADGKELIGGLAGLVMKAKVVLDEHGKPKTK